MAQPGNPFVGTSEMAERMRAFDWPGTPLGPVDAWPTSLRTVVQVLLTSRYAMWMGWGPELTFLYNDTYGQMTLGAKHPWALGRPLAAGVGRDLATNRAAHPQGAAAPARRPGTRRCCSFSSAAATRRRPTTRSRTARLLTTTARFAATCASSPRRPSASSARAAWRSLRDLGDRSQRDAERARTHHRDRANARRARAVPAVHADVPCRCAARGRQRSPRPRDSRRPTPRPFRRSTSTQTLRRGRSRRPWRTGQSSSTRSNAASAISRWGLWHRPAAREAFLVAHHAAGTDQARGRVHCRRQPVPPAGRRIS